MFLTTINIPDFIQQMTDKAGCAGTHCADVDGAEAEFQTFFIVDWFYEENFKDTHGTSIGHTRSAQCTLIGAVAYDEDGQVMFAGNRAQAVALVGQTNVDEWEWNQSERMAEAGE